MIHYGYINDNGNLVSREVTERIDLYTDEETGEQKKRIISIEEIVADLSAHGLKPVRFPEEESLICSEEGYIIKAQPYDAGDHIDFHLTMKFDVRKCKDEIIRLKEELADSDYKVTKSYEASLVGEQLPYNMKELHTKRQAIRDRINELEKQLL